MPLTKLNNKAVANVTILPVALGDMVLVSSATASSSASIEFTLGNYKEYKFFFVNIHPANDGVTLEWQVSTDNGSTYATTVTNTFFRSRHNESDTTTALQYETSYDQAQGTSFIRTNGGIGNQNDENHAMILNIFNPSSTNYVKHYIFVGSNTQDNDFAENLFGAGYFNTTSALTNIKFQMSSGNIDAGKILMFGIN